MAQGGRSLKARAHHNIRGGDHGIVRQSPKRPAISTFGGTAILARAACGTVIPKIHYRPASRSRFLQFR
jgi:hypothetical protein